MHILHSNDSIGGCHLENGGSQAIRFVAVPSLLGIRCQAHGSKQQNIFRGVCLFRIHLQPHRCKMEVRVLHHICVMHCSLLEALAMLLNENGFCLQIRCTPLGGGVYCIPVSHA
jgi:hypothetical protein